MWGLFKYPKMSFSVEDDVSQLTRIIRLNNFILLPSSLIIRQFIRKCLSLRPCLRVWRENDGRGLKKMKEQVEEMDHIERGKLWGFIFLHNTKSSSFEELKNCIE